MPSMQVEMILQALEYEMGNPFFLVFSASTVCFLLLLICYHNIIAEQGKVLDEFFLSTAGKLAIGLQIKILMFLGITVELLSYYFQENFRQR